jgi:hypothetical protein
MWPYRHAGAAQRRWQGSGRPIARLRFKTFGNSGRFASDSLPIPTKSPRRSDLMAPGIPT